MPKHCASKTPENTQKHSAEVQALQAALLAGLRSGPAQPFDFEAFKARKRAAKSASLKTSP